MNKPIRVTFDDQVAINVGIESAVTLSYLKEKFLEGRYLLDLQDIYNDIPIYTNTLAIKKCVEKLVLAGYIIEKELTSLEKCELLSGKKMTGLGVGNKVCEWCGCKTTVLHGHHYPIQKKDNGTELVQICANCHYEYHHIRNELIIGVE